MSASSERAGKLSLGERSAIGIEDLNTLEEITRGDGESYGRALIAAHAGASVIHEEELSRGVMGGDAIGNAVENPGKELRA